MSKRDDLEIIVAASTEQLAGDLNKAAAMLKAFGKQVERVKPPQMPTLAGVVTSVAPWRAVERSALSVSSAFRSAASSISSFASRAASTAVGLAAYQAGLVGVSGALDTVRDSVKLAADLEQTQVAFETMLGSAERAAGAVSDLRKFAAQTPFNSKETFDAARQLLAYGTAADQLIPTLRVLGDISASNPQGAPLGDVAYLFGTLKTQGRAFARDIYQFAGRGIDILPGLAKQFGVTKQEVMQLVEEGRVGFPEVAKALEELTAAGGRFHGMMDRQSKTLRGMWEIAADAWEVAKTRFGQIIIEEAGLKDATRDFESFAKRVEAGMERVRPAVRFVADLTKGVVQLGYEFGRAGLRIAELNLEGAARAFPELQNVRDMIRDLQNFKISPERINRLGLDIFKGIGFGVAKSIDFIETEGKSFYDAFDANFIKPVRAMIDALKEAREWVQRVRIASAVEAKSEEVLREGDRLLIDPANRARFEQSAPRESVVGAYTQFYHRLATQESLTGPMRTDESAGSFAARYRELNAGLGAVSRLKELGENGADDKLARLLDYRLRNFLIPFSENPEKDFPRLHETFMRGEVPPLRAGFSPVQPPARSRAEQFGDFFAQFEAEINRRAEADKLAEAAAEAQSRAAADWSRAYETARPALAALPFVGNLFRPAGLDIERLPGANLIDLAKKIKDEIDPLRDVMRQKGQYDQAVEFGLLSRREAEFAHERDIREAAEKLGIGGEPKLASAANEGTVEAARLIAQFRAGTAQTRTDDLLSMIESHVRAIVGVAGRVEQAPEPRPVVVVP